MVLSGCGSGSASHVNTPPTANPDSFSLIENTPTNFAILANDTDSDGSLTGGISIVSTSIGKVTVKGNTVSYTPDPGFTGQDTFSYKVSDNDGAASNTALVTISVLPITVTSLTVQSLAVPQSGYLFTNNVQTNSNLLTSPPQTLDIPPNTVSFLLMMRGTGVSMQQGGLFIANLIEPNGISLKFRDAIFCNSGFCTADVPKRADITAMQGHWHFELGANGSSIGNIDFSHIQLQVAIRVGPAPDPAANYPATIVVRPFLASSSITASQLQPVLDALVQLAASNQLKLIMDPLTVITDPRYSEVSEDFTDTTTAALVSMGGPNEANLFFLDSFTGSDGAATIGISPGIPGTLGVKSNLNGVLINATATYGGSTSFYAITTAEFTFHEMGHLLGLFHTTESDFNQHDILDDTPECTSADDANHNQVADVSECPDGLNLMFWTNDFSRWKNPLTNDQKMVLFNTVIAAP